MTDSSHLLLVCQYFPVEAMLIGDTSMRFCGLGKYANRGEKGPS